MIVLEDHHLVTTEKLEASKEKTSIKPSTLIYPQVNLCSTHQRRSPRISEDHEFILFVLLRKDVLFWPNKLPLLERRINWIMSHHPSSSAKGACLNWENSNPDLSKTIHDGFKQMSFVSFAYTICSQSKTPCCYYYYQIKCAFPDNFVPKDADGFGPCINSPPTM